MEIYRFDFLSVKSLKDYTSILREKSWELYLGGGGEFLSSPRLQYVWKFGGGYGFSKDVFGGKVYALSSASLLSSALECNQWGGQAGFDFGLGPLGYRGLTVAFRSSPMYNSIAQNFIIDSQFDCWFNVSENNSVGGFFRLGCGLNTVIGMDSFLGFKHYF